MARLWQGYLGSNKGIEELVYLAKREAPTTCVHDTLVLSCVAAHDRAFDLEPKCFGYSSYCQHAANPVQAVQRNNSRNLLSWQGSIIPFRCKAIAEGMGVTLIPGLRWLGRGFDVGARLNNVSEPQNTQANIACDGRYLLGTAEEAVGLSVGSAVPPHQEVPYAP
eukprot:6481295-Amphidinium_carterae.1